VAAIDGSKFKAVNARDKNFARAKLQKRMEQVEASIERYLSAKAHEKEARSAKAKTEEPAAPKPAVSAKRKPGAK